VFQQLKKAVIEQALGAELGLHLADLDGGLGNHRNGRSGKTVLTDDGPLRIDVPRDRTGTFEPQLIPKHERRFAGFDERIVSMYARGMTIRETSTSGRPYLPGGLPFAGRRGIQAFCRFHLFG